MQKVFAVPGKKKIKIIFVTFPNKEHFPLKLLGFVYRLMK